MFWAALPVVAYASDVSGKVSLLVVSGSKTRVGSMDGSFFNSYMAVPRPTMSHYQRSNLTQWMLITTFSQFGPKSHQEPHNKVGYLRRAETLVGFEPRTFRFWLQNLNQLGLSRQKIWKPYKFDNF